jgi:hypothetical protein
MNNLEKWFWSLLSTKGSEFTSLAVKQPGPVSVQAAEDADTEEVLSVREDGSNAGKYVAEYLKAVGLGVGNPWCMAFVVFRVIKAAHKLIVNIPAHMPRTGSVAVYGNWAQSQGHFIRRADLELGKSVPMKGDIVVYWFSSKGRLAHAGIVVEGGKNFLTVEGNTSGGIDTGVDRDGQGTYKKSRKYSHLGIFGGIIRLPY